MLTKPNVSHAQGEQSGPVAFGDYLASRKRVILTSKTGPAFVRSDDELPVTVDLRSDLARSVKLQSMNGCDCVKALIQAGEYDRALSFLGSIVRSVETLQEAGL